MNLTLSPVSAFNQLLRLDRRIALPLVAGLAALAAAAIFSTWRVDGKTTGLLALYILALGVVVIVAANAIQNNKMRLVLGWFLTLLVIASLTSFFVSAVFRQQGLINPPYCLIEFWKSCALVERGVVARNAEAIDASAEASRESAPQAAPAAQQNFDPRRYRVFIQFSGLITREGVTALNSSLAGTGFQMQGSSGQRLPAALGVNEVRYTQESDRPAAEALAAQVTAAGLASRALTARQIERITPNTLEIWMSN